MEFLIEAFDRLANSSVMHRALLGGSLIALVGPVLGVFLVLRRYALFAEGMGHIIFGGVGLALLMRWDPIWTSLATAVASGLGIEEMRAQRRFSGDMAIAIFLTAGLGAGILFARLAGESAGAVERYLFGGLSTLSWSDVLLAAILVGVVFLTLLVIGKELFAITFDEESAQAGGISARWLNRILTVLAALVIVASMRITGVLLASALIVLPTAASLQLARSFRQALLLAVFFGLLTVNAGLVLAYFANWVPSASIVVTGAAIFGVTWLAHHAYQLWRQKTR